MTRLRTSELVSAGAKTLTFDGCDRPIKANYGDVGYYRVHYDESNLAALGAVYRQLSAADRVSLLADAWAAVLAGLSAPATYLELTRSLSDETELAVWEASSNDCGSSTFYTPIRRRERLFERMRGPCSSAH